MGKQIWYHCSLEIYGHLILLNVQYMVEPFCLTNFSATSHSTHPVAVRLARQGEKANPHSPCRFCMGCTPFPPGGCPLVTEPIGIEPILRVLIFVTSILGCSLILESPCQSSSPLPPFSFLKREQEGEGRMIDRGSPKLVISPKLMSQKWGHSKSALYQ